MAITNNLFKLTLPDEWKETTVYTFEGPFDSGVQHNLVLVIDPFIGKDTTIQEYANQQIEGPKNTMPGFELISEGEKKRADNAPAYEFVYKYVPAENVVLYQKQVYILLNEKACVFTATFSKKTLKTIAVDIDVVIANFKLLESEE
ncbi:MAG: DcrB-related protein [Chitinivibrionales bacterium]|nr:DcrB-related protein [Chitinivibrionales bacterium]